MKMGRTALLVLVSLAALFLSDIATASLVYEYRLYVDNTSGDQQNITYTIAPQMLSTDGAQASATSNSLSAYAGNWYYEPGSLWVGSAAVAEIKVRTDSPIRFDLSFNGCSRFRPSTTDRQPSEKI
jgi:hypothetical protein